MLAVHLFSITAIFPPLLAASIPSMFFFKLHFLFES